MGVFSYLIDLAFYAVYLAIFAYIFKVRRKKLNDPVLEHYHKIGFWIKALMVVPFVFFNSKLSPGDSYVLYHVEGKNIYNLILKNSSNLRFLIAPGTEYDQSGLLANSWNLGYCRDENNFTIVRISAFLSFFTFGRYTVNCLIFSLVSFSGVWRMFRFFYEQYPHLHKQIAISFLFLPTFVFWCSGMLKDPLCIGAMGWITYAVYEGFYKKKRILQNGISILIAAYVLVVLKIYILVSYLPFLVLYLILKNVNLIKSTFSKVVLVGVMFVGIILGFSKIMGALTGAMGEFGGNSMTQTIQDYQKNYAAQESWATSNFKLPVEFDGSMGSLVKMAPFAVMATLYRPYIWESRSPTTILTSFESMAILYFTLRVIFLVGFANFFKAIRNPVIMYCFSFSILFALFVGATTPNFGTLCRYKIPCTPFYVIALFLILDMYGFVGLKKKTDANSDNDKTKKPA